MPRSTLLLALIPMFIACGGSSSGADADGTSGIPPVGMDSSGTIGGSGSTGDAGTVADTSGGPEGPCETLLCGESASCCAAEEECAAGACLPVCESGVRCGPAQDICCGEGQVCLSDTCTTPTGPCSDSFDCDFGEFCEPTLGECLPQSDPVVCEVEPEFEDIDASEEWAFVTDQRRPLQL